MTWNEKGIALLTAHAESMDTGFMENESAMGLKGTVSFGGTATVGIDESVTGPGILSGFTCAARGDKKIKKIIERK